MKEAIQMLVSWVYPLATIILIVLVNTRKGLKGKSWLVAHLVGSVVVMMMWRIPELLFKLDIIDSNCFSMFIDWFGIPLGIVGLAAFCLLIPYVLTASSGQNRIGQLSKPEKVLDKYAAYLSVDPVSQTKRMLLWMSPDILSVLKQSAAVQGHVDVATPDGKGSIQSVSKADIDWAVSVDKLAERASSASKLRQYREAVKAYMVALDKAPGADIYLMSIGSCLAMLGDKSNALRFMQRSHEINPQNKQIAANLRKCQKIS